VRITDVTTKAVLRLERSRLPLNRSKPDLVFSATHEEQESTEGQAAYGEAVICGAKDGSQEKDESIRGSNNDGVSSAGVVYHQVKSSSELAAFRLVGCAPCTSVIVSICPP
jgi:hypothetical protein